MERTSWLHVRGGGDAERGQQADHPDNMSQSQWASAAAGNAAEWYAMNSEQGLSTPSAAVNDVRDELSGIRAQLENMHSTIDLARDANIATHTAMHSAHREMANELKQFVSSELTVIQDELKDVCAHLQQQQKVAQKQVLKLLCLFVCLFVTVCLFVGLLVLFVCLFDAGAVDEQRGGNDGAAAGVGAAAEGVDDGAEGDDEGARGDADSDAIPFAPAAGVSGAAACGSAAAGAAAAADTAAAAADTRAAAAATDTASTAARSNNDGTAARSNADGTAGTAGTAVSTKTQCTRRAAAVSSRHRGRLRAATTVRPLPATATALGTAAATTATAVGTAAAGTATALGTAAGTGAAAAGTAAGAGDAAGAGAPQEQFQLPRYWWRVRRGPNSEFYCLLCGSAWFVLVFVISFIHFSVLQEVHGLLWHSRGLRFAPQECIGGRSEPKLLVGLGGSQPPPLELFHRQAS